MITMSSLVQFELRSRPPKEMILQYANELLIKDFVFKSPVLAKRQMRVFSCMHATML